MLSVNHLLLTLSFIVFIVGFNITYHVPGKAVSICRRPIRGIWLMMAIMKSSKKSATLMVCSLLRRAASWLQSHQSVSRKVSKGAKIRNRYNQVPHLTKYTNEKVTDSQLDTTNESQ